MALVQERLVEVEADKSVVSDRRPVREEKTFRAYDRPRANCTLVCGSLQYPPGPDLAIN